MAWRWLSPSIMYALHDRQIAEHGGMDGIRDQGMIESALARPQQLAAYGEPDVCDLAAAYAFGLIKNHGFADGNKRTAWIAARVFLADQGIRLDFEKAEAVSLMERAAAGQLSEAELAGWFRERIC